MADGDSGRKVAGALSLEGDDDDDCGSNFTRSGVERTGCTWAADFTLVVRTDLRFLGGGRGSSGSKNVGAGDVTSDDGWTAGFSSSSESLRLDENKGGG